MCRSVASGSPRRCKAHSPAARKARYASRTAEQKKVDSAKRRARYLASKEGVGGREEFAETIAAAEIEQANWERWLSTLTPLQAELAQCAGGVEGLDERWGLTHTREVIWGPDEMDELGVPKPGKRAGRVKSVTVSGRDISVEWQGEGDRSARRRYVGRLRTWLAGLLDGWATALRERDGSDSQSQPQASGRTGKMTRGRDDEEGAN